MRNIKAFTLAEVLITLTIIGVIAALTIPNLMQKYFEYTAISRAKQTYSQLGNAYRMFAQEQGCNDSNIYGCFSTKEVTEESMEPMMKYLKVKEIKCRTTSGNYNDIKWIPENSTNLQGLSPAACEMNLSKKCLQPNNCMYLLENGVVLSISSEYYFGGDGDRRRYLVMDINGAKAPNRIGIDQFPFGIMQNLGLSPDPVMHPWSGWWSREGLCARYPNPPSLPYISCGGNTNIPERRPLYYIIKNGKLPDLSKVSQ